MVAVIGVSDEVRGEIIKAIVVPKDKSIIKSGNIELKKRIKEHVKNNLAAYEYPRLIEFKKGLPLTTTCLLYTSPSPRDLSTSRMPSSA